MHGAETHVNGVADLWDRTDVSASHAALLMVGSGVTPLTWNPADKGVNPTLSNGNLTVLGVGGASCLVRATANHTTTGKYYFEVVMDVVATGANAPKVAIAGGSVSLSNSLGYGGAGPFASIQSSGAFTYNNGSYKSSGVTFANGDRCNVAVDLGANKIWFGKNGTYILSGNPAAGTNATWAISAATAFFPASFVNSTSQVTAHFASGSWVDAAPSGFGAW